MRRTILMAVLLAALAGALEAQTVPGLINYQGMLRDGTGVPISDASVPMDFKLWDQAVIQENVTDENITMNGTSPIPLAHSDVFPGAMVVVTGVGGVPVYETPRDYTIDYPSGTITRVPTGFITDGTVVEVDYDWISYGNSVWSESQVVEAVNGLYQVKLGSSAPIAPAMLSAGTLYLEVTVGGEVLSPRQRLTSVPFALVADSLDGLDSTDFAVAVHGHDFSELSGTADDSQVPDNITINYALDAGQLGGQAPDAYVSASGDTITGDLQVNGGVNIGTDLEVAGDVTVWGENIGLGTSASTMYGLHNTNLTSSNYGVYVHGIVQGVVGRWGTDPSDHYGILGGQIFGVFGRSGNSDENISNTGGHFIAYSLESVYGVAGYGYGYGSYGAYGSYGLGQNNSNGSAYGGRFETSSAGTGPHYGVSGYGLSQNSGNGIGVHGMGQSDGTGNSYGGYFETVPGGGGTHYGIFADSDLYAAWLQGGRVHVGDAGTQDYVTGNGDLYVENVLEADGNAYVGGDAAVLGNHLGIGRIPDPMYGIVNDSASAPYYGAYILGNGYGLMGRLSSDPNDHFGTLGSLLYGVAGRAGASDESGNRYGGSFEGYSQGMSYGIFATAHGYSVDSATGAYAQGVNASSGTARGVYGYGYKTGGSGDSNGIYGYAYNNSPGNSYGGYFTTSIAGTGTHYGVFSSVSDDYAGWFQGGRVHVGNLGTEDYVDGDGDLYVEDELEADGDAYIGGDLAVFGNNIGLGTLANSSYGIANNSATAPTFGVYMNGSGYGLYGRLASDPLDHYGYIGSLSTGVYARAGASDETGDRFGGQFYARSQGAAYGVDANAYGYGVNETIGVAAYGNNGATGTAQGVNGYGYKEGGSGDAQGVYGLAYNNSPGDAYGGYFTASNSGTGTHYGVYAQADDYAVWAAYGPDPTHNYAYLGGPYYAVLGISGSSDGTGDKIGGGFGAETQDYATGVVAYAQGRGIDSAVAVSAQSYNSGSGNSYGVLATSSASGGGAAYGLYVSIGSKSWVNPDPEDPGQAVAYVTVESGENVTYYSSQARLENGRVVIELPDHFRKVTSPDYPVTVQLTPRSTRTYGLAVTESSNERIVVEELMDGTGNFQFDYTVKGMRLGYEDYQPIIDNVDYVPFQGNQASMDESKMTTQEFYDQQSAGLKRIFKQNGTLDKEGKVNEAVFKQKGWKMNKEKKPKNDRP